MTVRYLDTLERLEYEIVQRREERHDIRILGDAFDALRANTDPDSREATYKLLADHTAKNATGSGPEPDNLITIQPAARNSFPRPQSSLRMDDADLYNRILGGWQGHAAGCLLSKTVERHARPILRKLFESNDTWALESYWTQAGMS